jgi:CheY-like chemotaxis protein
MLGEQRFDAVLMDLQMPVMDGFAATRAIRAMPGLAAVPVIALSANASPDDRRRCVEAGMVDFVAKPVNPEHLIAVVGNWLSESGMENVGPEPAALDSAGPRLAQLRQVAGLDVDRGLMLVGGREGLYLSIVEKFIAGNGNFSEQLRAQIEAGNWADAVRTAHTLKGTAGQIGAGQLQAAAAELEQALRSEPTAVETRALMQKIEDLLAGLLAALARNLATGASAEGAPTCQPIDRTRLKQICDELEERLARDDYASNEMFVENAELLRAGLGENHEWIAEAINGFNYPAALDWLREARRSWQE